VDAGLIRFRLRGVKELSGMGVARAASRSRRLGGLHVLGSDPAGVHLYGRRSDAVRVRPSRSRRGLVMAAVPARCLEILLADRAEQHLFELGTVERTPTAAHQRA